MFSIFPYAPQEIIGIAAIGSAVIYAILLIYKSALVQKSLSWLPATATILNSEVVRHRSQNTMVFKAKIEYEYHVGSENYRSSVICLGGEFNSSARKRAEARCSKYPQGEKTTVYYNPTKPSQCCLERKMEGVAFGVFVLIICMIVGFLLIFGVFG